MKLSKKSNTGHPKWNYPLLAFAVPFLALVLVMAVSGYTPFGRYSMLYSDMYHQYYPFFVGFRRALLSGDSLLYNWDVGLGMDYVGLMSYYLASPLNLLSVLVPERFLLQYFSFLVPLKLGLASLFFAYMLKKLYGKNDASLVFFGASYGLCAWALGFQWNVMWLDTFALLPLVVLGAVQLLRDKKVILYTLTLALSVAANYYVGFFTCIFILLFFVVYEICRWRSFGRFAQDLGRIALFSLLAIGMTMILELPTLAALQNTQSSVNNFPTGFRLNIADENTWKGLLDAMRQVAGNMGGGQEFNFKEGLPNIYCGVGMVFLAVLFLISRKVMLREKICAVTLLLFFMLSFIIRQLDYIWHGFHFTNMIPYRFSFLYSFVVLYMAYRAWLVRHSFRAFHVTLAAVISLALFACSDLRSQWLFALVNIGFTLLYLGTALYGVKREPKRTEDAAEGEELQKRITRRRTAAGLTLAGLITAEIAVNVVNFGVQFPGTAISNYPRGTEAAASMIRYMHEREADTPFYRAEVTHTQTLNDGALNHYHGITTFTSSANVKVTEFMKALGFSAKNTYNRYSYENGSPVANLMLDLKYLIERDHAPIDNHYFAQVHSYEDVYLLENRAYLPLGFLAEPGLKNADLFTNFNSFTKQNELFTAMTGELQPVWNMIPKQDLVISAVGGTVDLRPSLGSCGYDFGEAGGTEQVVYTYTIHQDGFLCLDLNLPKRNNYTVSKNDRELYRESISLPQLIAVGNVKAGDVITVKVSKKNETSGNMTILAGLLDESVFQRGYQTLAASPLVLDSFSNTHLTGSIDCDRDGLLYTSVPQNGNWHLLVDGEEVEPVLVGDVMIAADLTQGSHEIEFVYRNPAFSLGWKIALACAAVFVLLVVFFYPVERRRGKFEHVKHPRSEETAS